MIEHVSKITSLVNVLQKILETKHCAINAINGLCTWATK